MKLKYLFLSFCFFSLLGPVTGQERPNMIIFISDDQSQIDVGSYGNEDVITPNMDQLASEGMRFTKAYAASSMCTPSRSSFFTGLYPERNGSQHNHFSVKPGTKTLPHYLKALGYRVVIAGKTHVRPKSAFPFEYISKEMGKYSPVEGRSDPRGETVQFIKDFFSSEEESKQPLCLVIATWWPHVPWLPNKSFDPEELSVPEYLVDSKQTRKALAQYYESIKEADKQLGEVLTAVEEGGEENTVFMFFSDQGVQFPGAKWTTYDQGLRVPLIVKWPGKVKAGSVSDALVSLTDLTPTLIDLAGGVPGDNLDGKSFANVFLGKKEEHRDFIFAETSVEPHYWYNYTPSRTIITRDGYHYIRNYVPGARFITHIDAFQGKEHYFDSWIEAAEEHEKAEFLLQRYSFRPPEELYNLKNDKWELNNLVGRDGSQQQLLKLRKILDEELERQGESRREILRGQLPVFHANSYEIMQGISAHPMSFDKEKWNPEVLYITGFIEGLKKEGVVTNYFNQFTVFLKDQRLGVVLRNGEVFFSSILSKDSGHLEMKITADGNLRLKLDGELLISENISGDFTKINGGYVSSGFIRNEPLEGLPDYFQGEIQDLRFTMNKLNGEH